MKMTTAVSKFVRATLLAAPIALAPAISTVVLGGMGFGSVSFGAAYAAEEKAAEKPKYKTKKSYSLRQKIYKKFAKVQEKTDAEDWNGALEVLKGIESGSESFTSFEKANLWNYFGWIYYSLEEFKPSVRYYEKVLAEEQLSAALELGTLQTVAQLKFVQEDYKGAIKLLRKFVAKSEIVGADIYVLISQGYYQLGDMKQSLENVSIAVSRYEAKGKVPKENWYSLQRAVHFELGNNKAVIKILEKMVRHYPKTTYWKQLAGMYGQVNREKDQLHATEVVYLTGGLTKEKELMNLAYMFLGQDAPIKSANVIRKGIKAKQIEETSKNLEVYASALRMAQEVKKSIPIMAEAAKKSKKGDLYARLAGVYLDNDQHKQALDAASRANKRGKVKRPDQLNIIVGMANVNLGKYASAIKAFKLAAKDKRTKKSANQWINYAEGELKREKQMTQ